MARVHLSAQNCELYGFVPVPHRSLRGKFPPNQAIIIALSALKIELKSIAFITFYPSSEEEDSRGATGANFHPQLGVTKKKEAFCLLSEPEIGHRRQQAQRGESA